MTPGFNLKWPGPIETVGKVDATTVRTTSDQVAMLTNDQNIVQVHVNVQYQVSDPRWYLYSVREPDDTLKQAAESAVRSVIGASDMDTILSGQRAELMADAKRILQATVDQYSTGIFVTELNFQDVRPPHEVKDAFDDAIRAKEDRTTAENEAKAYASKVVPEARGDAARIRAEAEGYKAERTARAQGDAERFTLIADEYKLAPEVTRKRLYLETMQQVVGTTPKVIDLSAGKNLLYLPIAPDATGAQTVGPPVGAVVNGGSGGAP
jgi:membrane protease subunit HflK